MTISKQNAAKQEIKRISMWFPVVLWASIKTQAAREDRSATSLVYIMCREGLKTRKTKGSAHGSVLD